MPRIRKLREDLAGCYRIFHELGWTELIYNHISVRTPRATHSFLINRFGLRYDEVTASNLVEVDLEGRPLDEPGAPINPAGFVIHSALHGAIPDAMCVMHTHTTAGMAVSCKRGGLRITNFYAAMLAGQIGYHPFEGVTVNPDECVRFLANLGDRRQMILENHGLLTWGSSIEEAFVRMWTLNRACEVQLASQAMGGEDIPVSEAAWRQASAQALQFKPEHGAGRDVYEALLRNVEARDPGYRM